MGTLLLILLDTLGMFFSYQFSYYIRCFVFPKYLALPEPLPLALFNPIWLPVIFIFLFWYENLYSKKYPFWEEVKVIWKACILATLALLSVVTISKMTSSVSRTILLLTLLNSFWILPPLRYYGKRLMFRLGIKKRKVLIAGAGATGELLLKTLSKEKNMGYEVIGFVDDNIRLKGKMIGGARVLGKIKDIDNFLSRGVEVIVAIPGMEGERIVALVNSLQKKVKSVSFIPNLFGIPFFESDMDFHFESQILILNVRNNLKNRLNMSIKNLFDIFVSIPVFIISLPVIALVAVLIKLDSKGPVFFAQERIGVNGKAFRCIKFRSMYVDAEKILAKLLKQDKKLNAEWKKYLKLKNDPRVTKIGKLIRKFSLDELPQVFNIIKGDMSLVGPRPYLPREAKDMESDADTMVEVRPGLTGLWQVSGRNKTSFKERLVLDAWYIQNWSLWLDIVILIRTVKVVFKREGAY